MKKILIILPLVLIALYILKQESFSSKKFIFLLKSFDETIDLRSTTSSKEKARLEMIFATKKILEIQKLTNEGDYSLIPSLSKGVVEDVNKSVFFTKAAIGQGEDIESLMWVINDLSYDQQRIYSLILEKLPKDQRQDILESQNKLQESLEGLSNNYF